MLKLNKNLGCSFITLIESRTIINDLGVILHGFMLQIIYTYNVFPS